MKRLLTAAVLGCLCSCGDKVETTMPVVQNITESVYASGTVKSRNQYQAYSSVNGIIRQILVTEGDLVRKGDAIITLINETPKLNSENARLSAAYLSEPFNSDRLQELRINIDLARAKMQNDSLLLQRQRNLWAQGIGSRNELEQRELVWKNAVTAWRSALLRYGELKKQVDFSAQQSRNNLRISTVLANDYTITARQDGKIYSLLKDPGEMVSTQMPVAIIGDAREFIVELQVDEYDITRIKTGQKIFLGMDSYKGQVFEAVVDRIDPIMDDHSRSFKVEASFAAQPPSLYPNLTVEANILISVKKNTLTIPRTYLTDENHVLLQNGEKRKITVGLKDYQRVEVVSGLSKDAIIKKPSKSL